MNNSKGEWNVAYHGVAYNKTSDQVKKSKKQNLMLESQRLMVTIIK